MKLKGPKKLKTNQTAPLVLEGRFLFLLGFQVALEVPFLPVGDTKGQSCTENHKQYQTLWYFRIWILMFG